MSDVLKSFIDILHTLFSHQCNKSYNKFRYARTNNFAHLEHTTLPRMGAVQAILSEVGPRAGEDSQGFPLSRNSSSRLKLIKDTVDALREKKYVKGTNVKNIFLIGFVVETRPPIKYILDVTIAYPNGHPLSLGTLLFGTREKCDIAVNYKVYKASEVPFSDETKLRDWLYEVYEEKDKMLGKLSCFYIFSAEYI